VTSLILAALCFAAIHLAIAGTTLRDRAVAFLGEGPYLGLFSLASAAGLGWMIMAYNAAPYLPSWGPLLWWKWVALPLMLIAALLFTIGLITPNPTALKQERFVTAEPKGIVRVTRHPFLMGVALWALVHLVGNGDWASLVFFGGFAVVAIAGPASIDAKRRRALGAAAWQGFASRTSILPFAAIAQGRNRFDAAEIGLLRWALGFAVYALLLGAHGPLIGISPFPD
jgi:uncharacterized membrane protein